MRLHLLEHDSLDLPKTNIHLWAESRGHPLRHTYVCNRQELPELEDFDWLMVMGGSPHAWDMENNPWLGEEKAFLSRSLNAGKIILGICFGAQLLAEAVGGGVFPNEHPEIGWFDVTLTADGRASFLFKDIPGRFMTFHWHSDHFSLPPGCVRLASSEPTPNQAFLYPGRPVVGLQFHPEYTREVVIRFARSEASEWAKGPFSNGAEAVLEKTLRLPDTRWLMFALLDNMEKAFGSNSSRTQG
ncbi:MAG: type 1 glutamine amidotransferase [Acidobacteriota bacterium]